MKILENKGICMVLMLVLIVCGFLLGGYKGLAGQYRKAADVFLSVRPGTAFASRTIWESAPMR